jgi:hypothetical protein
MQEWDGCDGEIGMSPSHLGSMKPPRDLVTTPGIRRACAFRVRDDTCHTREVAHVPLPLGDMIAQLGSSRLGLHMAALSPSSPMSEPSSTPIKLARPVDTYIHQKHGRRTSEAKTTARNPLVQ